MHKGFGEWTAGLADGGDASIRRRGRGHEDPHPGCGRRPAYDKKTMAARGHDGGQGVVLRLDGKAYHALHAKEPKTRGSCRTPRQVPRHARRACGREDPSLGWSNEPRGEGGARDSAHRREVEASGLQVSASVPDHLKEGSRLHEVLRRQQVPQDRGRREGNRFVVTDGALNCCRRCPI